jgi:hypothetical protein
VTFGTETELHHIAFRARTQLSRAEVFATAKSDQDAKQAMPQRVYAA